MKTRTVILPVTFPRLSNAGAAQLVAALQILCENVAHHYAGQVHRHQRGLANRRHHDQLIPGEPTDSLF